MNHLIWIFPMIAYNLLVLSVTQMVTEKFLFQARLYLGPCCISGRKNKFSCLPTLWRGGGSWFLIWGEGRCVSRGWVRGVSKGTCGLTHPVCALVSRLRAGLPSPDDCCLRPGSAGYSPAAHSSPVHPNGPRAWRGQVQASPAGWCHAHSSG